MLARRGREGKKSGDARSVPRLLTVIVIDSMLLPEKGQKGLFFAVSIPSH
jgi:hypothetical protein